MRHNGNLSTKVQGLHGDEVYGRSGQLRQACEKAGKGYVLGVPVNFRVTLPSGRAAACPQSPR